MEAVKPTARASNMVLLLHFRLPHADNTLSYICTKYIERDKLLAGNLNVMEQLNTPTEPFIKDKNNGLLTFV